MMFFNKKLNKLCVVMRNSFEFDTDLFSEKKNLFPSCYVAKQLFQSHILLIYFLLKSFIRIHIETWNLSFCFQHYLFVLKLVIDRAFLQYLEFLFFFLIYELNAVLSTHSNIDFESVIYKLFLGKIYYDLHVV